ncbi:YceD family protein [Oceanobacillus senegalensis]|uniref:YceD family protein n=1 Tax=Oceanobacillus senegalensis TaxID=1936063 RepID=UPI000A30B857|nr:YceD family protein [Oceanobacillus senegalensis]
MKFTLAEIRKYANHEALHFDDYVDVTELESMNNDIRKIEPVHVHGQCTQRGEQYFFSFTMKGKVILPDARTLVDVPYPFTIKAKEVFTTSLYMTSEDEEQEIHPVDGDTIDLTPYIKENILLELPFRVISDQEAEDAPFSGEGWEFLSEEQKKSKVDPRLQKLQSLLDKKPKED